MRVPADPITGGASDEALSARFRAYAADLRHGDGLIAARLNTLLSSQSFLAITYVSCMASANGRWREPFALAVPPVLALLGFLLTFAGHQDMRAAKAEVANWRRLAEELLVRFPELRIRSTAREAPARLWRDGRRRSSWRDGRGSSSSRGGCWRFD